ncbi:hypothetical protein PVAP13_7NG215117 [Panicum virgatum]|uniref:Uncharacterized protein n=1 Tax=Panicum virgatum TaxID=38727 RepID=A0A8T0PVL9_PANVG|nr:hypothetical protein PVAP13_7NG215117 [Panicum virgatum]
MGLDSLPSSSAYKHLVREFKDRSMVPSTMSLSSSKSKTKQGQKKLRQWNCGYLLDISLPLSNFKTNTKVKHWVGPVQEIDGI